MKIVIWGSTNYSHTHAHVFYGFERAFRHLGYDVHWLPDIPATAANLKHEKDVVVFTEGNSCAHMPKRPDWKYILHNCDLKDFSFEQRLLLQVYTPHRRPTAEQIGPFMHFDKVTRQVYMPWATDLLPHEIVPKEYPATRAVNWVGTISDKQPFDNASQLQPFRDECRKNDVEFIHWHHVGHQQHHYLIRSSLIAPTIVGRWQLENEFIPCRIFKTISYGKKGVTNSPTINKLFEGRLICNINTDELFHDALSTPQDVPELMDFVAKNHTYVQRIQTLMPYL